MVQEVTVLPDNFNLNVLSKAGWYGVATPVNGPSSSNFFIRVLHAPIGGISRVMQIAHRDDGRHSSTRMFGTTGWSSWIHTSSAHASDLSVNLMYFTSSGTWTKPDGLRSVSITAIGGGGAGGTAESTNSGQLALGTGGAAGGEVLIGLQASALGATETITIGVGGSRAVGFEEDGQDSSFGSSVRASGGSRGRNLDRGSSIDVEYSRGGFSYFDGDINIPERQGGPAIRMSGSKGVAGDGGHTSMGMAGKGAQSSDVGGTGLGHGSGGGGARNSGTQATEKLGGSGAPGIVVVTEYF